MEKTKEKKKLTQEDIMALLSQCYTKVNAGIPHVSPKIEDFANDYLSKEKVPEKAAKKMLNNQVAKCTTSGFLTGLGGVLTLPVTIPANISSVLYVQMRMISCTAYMAGYDPNSDQTQTLVYACLAGVSIVELVKQTAKLIGTKMATAAIKKLPGEVCVKINQKVGFRLLTKFGSKGAVNLGKMVPIVGGIIGGGFDFVDTKIIAKRAYKWFFENDFSYGTEK